MTVAKIVVCESSRELYARGWPPVLIFVYTNQQRGISLAGCQLLTLGSCVGWMFDSLT